MEAEGHPEELEAALCAAYAPRDPIAEFWRGELTLRGLRVLVKGLPPMNALAIALYQDEHPVNVKPGDDLTEEEKHEMDDLSDMLGGK